MEEQSKIEELTFPENVRRNPYQLLGDLRDSEILLRELFDNCRDELAASKACNTVYVWTGDFNILADNGRGISVALSDDKTKTQMELACASIYAGGKFHSDKVQGGMHGIGMSAVNAVSDKFKIACKITEANWEQSNELVQEAVKDFFDEFPGESLEGNMWLLLSYEKGIKIDEKVVNKELLDAEFNRELPEDLSTIVGFTPDLSIVGSSKCILKTSWYEYTFKVLKEFYEKNITLIYNDQILPDNYIPKRFEYKNVIQLVRPNINKEVSFYVTFDINQDLSVKDISGCVNMITVNRGLHIQSAASAYADALKEVFGIEHKFLTEGLMMDVIFLANKVGYNSQTKENLVSVDAFEGEDWLILKEGIKQIIFDNKEYFEQHVQALNDLAATYASISEREYVKSMVQFNSEIGANKVKSFVPIKLKDCSSPNREECSLFIGEGSSAIGTIMKVRDPYYHACLPLRGVSMNAVFRSLEDVMQNDELSDLVQSIGAGIDDVYDLNGLRYNEIIITVDADFDGNHIAALLLGFFSAHMPWLIEAGKVYLLKSPFYKQDDKFIYQDEMDKLDKSRPFQRFKGLGSLHAGNPKARQEIIDIFINPNTRKLIQITPEGIDRAIMTVGDKHTRRRLMQNMNYVENKSKEFEEADGE